MNNSILSQLRKAKYRNLGFLIPEYEDRVHDFFSNTLSGFVISKTMNCEHPDFIDY